MSLRDDMQRLPYAPAIYRLVCNANGRSYIGSSNNCRARVSSHLSCLRHRSHHNIDLQSDWNAYGASFFSAHMILGGDDIALLRSREAIEIGLSPKGVLYNRGRESITPTKGYAQISTSLPPDVKAWLDQQSAALGIFPSHIVRGLVVDAYYASKGRKA